MEILNDFQVINAIPDKVNGGNLSMLPIQLNGENTV